MKILEWTDKGIRLLDQVRLPKEEIFILCDTVDKICEAIRSLRIRGAPSLGVASAYAVLLGATKIETTDSVRFLAELKVVADTVMATRPTAVNLFWAANEMLLAAQEASPGGRNAMLAALHDRATTIESDNKDRHIKLSEAGAALVEPGASILHHCNTGPLATHERGSALGVIYTAHMHEKDIHVFVDETRPLLQGARLTCWELDQWGVPYTLITDGMAGHFMRAGKIDMAVVGADRIAANGDTANKIGTYTAAVLAAHHGIPFYVAAPLTTVDFSLASGDGIPIEQRDPAEVRGYGDTVWAPPEAPVANPAFDVTPAELIAGIITEAGVARPDYTESLAAQRDQQTGMGA
jgi:methylthioribose-1-phosphate isomerase